MAKGIGRLARHSHALVLLAAGSITLAAPGLAAAHDAGSIPEGTDMTAVPGPAPSDVTRVAGAGTKALDRFIAFTPPPAQQAATPAADVDEAIGRDGRRRGASGEPGTWHRFAFRVPRRADSVRVRLSSGPGADLALYARRRVAPNPNAFACRDNLRANYASCAVDDPAPGRWYAGVLTRGGRVCAGFKVSVDVRR